MPYFEPFYFNKAPVDLEHLEPFELITLVEGSVDRLVRVTFSPHVFTRTWEETDDEADMSFDRRCYCPERYALSLALPKVVETFPKVRVYQTYERGSYVYVAQSMITENGIYHVFFTVRLHSSNRNQRVDMFVNSAYPKNNSPYVPPFVITKPNLVSFDRLIENTYSGKGVHFGRRKR